MTRSSSDILEERFGPTRLEILRQDEYERIICTKVARSSRVLELSWVAFRPPGTTAFREIHRRVMWGESMGKAFAAAGVEFHREVRVSYRADSGVPAIFRERFGSEAAPTITEVTVKVGPKAVPYADILEVYHPDVPPWETTDGPRQPERAVADRLEVFAAALNAMADTE